MNLQLIPGGDALSLECQIERQQARADYDPVEGAILETLTSVHKQQLSDELVARLPKAVPIVRNFHREKGR